MRTALRIMAKLRGLRGSVLDPFGYSTERREERALIREYRLCIEELLKTLARENLEMALEIASLPENIRGYGYVKARHLATVRLTWENLMARWRSAKAKEANQRSR